MRLTTEYQGAAITVDGGSAFASAIVDAIVQFRPTRIIETGTFHGLGTTQAILRGLRACAPPGVFKFHTIECNPQNAAVAALAPNMLCVQLHNALSVPRSMLPTMEDIQRDLVDNPPPACSWVDHAPENRARAYAEESAWDVPDDAIGKILGGWRGQCNLALLDSAGHMGYIEYQYLRSLLTTPCIIVLDDIYHVKHCWTMLEAESDPTVEVLSKGVEKFGFSILMAQPLGGSK